MRRSGTLASVPTVVVLDHSDPEVAAAIRDLQRAAYALEAALIGFGGIPTLHETADAVARLDLVVLGALDGGRLVGILGYRRMDDDVDVDRLAVDPGALRTGVATALLEELHRREDDARTFHVTTGADNGPAVALYTRLGYERAADRVLANGLRLAEFARR